MPIGKRHEMDISEIEVDGRAVSSIVQGVGSFSGAYEQRALTILEENGIPEPQPGDWYSMEAYLAAFDELMRTVGPKTVTKIGKKIPEVVEWPPEVDSVAGGLSALDDVYQMNHRGGDIGYYEFKKTGEAEGEIVCVNPYPPELDEGLISGVTKKFNDGGYTRVEEIERGTVDDVQKVTYSVAWM